jgi:type I restriction enzyme R subunit
MAKDPEEQARESIDAALELAGWQVQDREQANLGAGRGVDAREFALKTGHGHADYLLFVDGQAVGVIEAKPEGTTLTGLERQSGKYGAGLPDVIPALVQPLPFLYESTGVETRFTNQLDPDPRNRPLFAFHRAETLSEWLGKILAPTASAGPLRIAGLPGTRRDRRGPVCGAGATRSDSGGLGRKVSVTSRGTRAVIIERAGDGP